MLGNASLNLTQPINSFLRPLGFSLSSKEQIMAKITMLALGVIFIANSEFLSSVGAKTIGEAIEECNRLPTEKERSDCLRALTCKVYKNC
ncbi:MAG: hypothetical protein ACRCU0_06870 [Candidatus Rhabdochlamydia sp.]